MRGAAAPRAPDPDIKSRGVIRGPNPACPRKRSCGRLSVPMLAPDICQRAMRARDPRFDGVFFVGITTTGVYCRPVCPSRVARPSHRRFFESAALAERAGFRPCLRCRPELAPGRSQMDAVPRLARAAAQRIAAGALNGHALSQLARELGVSERHLRRAMEREIGVSPLALAQTHRLLLAKRLLADTALPVTRIAFASGFRSLRRFNSVFRERYGLSPSALRPRGVGRREYETVRLTLAYRPPFAWDVLIALLAREALPGVEVVRDGRYARTVRLAGERGVVFVAAGPAGANHLAVDVSPALLPALMTLLARLRHLFDLDAEPTVVDAHLAQGGLAALVERRPGVRLPGALDGFEAALRALLHGSSARARRREPAARAGRRRGGRTPSPAPDAGRRRPHRSGHRLARARLAGRLPRVRSLPAARRRSRAGDGAGVTRRTVAPVAGVRRSASVAARYGERNERAAGLPEASPAIGLGRGPELGAERAVEVRNVPEPHVERDVHDFRAFPHQPDGRLPQPGSQDELVRRDARNLPERSQIVKRAQSRRRGQASQGPARAGVALDGAQAACQAPHGTRRRRRRPARQAPRQTHGGHRRLEGELLP